MPVFEMEIGGPMWKNHGLDMCLNFRRLVARSVPLSLVQIVPFSTAVTYNRFKPYKTIVLGCSDERTIWTNERGTNLKTKFPKVRHVSRLTCQGFTLAHRPSLWNRHYYNNLFSLVILVQCYNSYHNYINIRDIYGIQKLVLGTLMPLFSVGRHG